MKRQLRSLHRMLGLSVGLWAAATALTGSVLVFGDEIDTALNPHLLRVVPRDSPWDLDTSIAGVRARLPGEPLTRVWLPRTAEDALVLGLGAERITRVYVDPYTATVLGARDVHGGVIGFLWELHAHLLAGETGKTIAGVLSLLLIGITVTGFVLWWPGRRRLRRGFTVRWYGRSLPLAYDLHRVAGAVTALLLLTSAVTGAMLVFHRPTTGALIAGLGGPALALPQAVRVPDGRARLPLSRLLVSAAAALPGAAPVSMSIPVEDDKPVVVRQRFPDNPHPNGRSFVSVDPYTADVLHVHDWRRTGTGVRVSDYKYPLHIGTAFDLPGRILVLATGLVPVLLLVTGGFVWWRRRRLPGPRRPLR